MNIKKLLNAPFIGLIGTAMYVGVMICIGFGLGGYWLTLEATTYAQMFQDIFPFLLPAIALTLLPGLVGVFHSFKTEKNVQQKRLWCNSLIAIVISIAITSFIALPLNFTIWSDGTSSADLAILLPVWLVMHAARLVAAFIGVAYAMKALNEKTSS